MRLMPRGNLRDLSLAAGSQANRYPDHGVGSLEPKWLRTLAKPNLRVHPTVPAMGQTRNHHAVQLRVWLSQLAQIHAKQCTDKERCKWMEDNIRIFPAAKFENEQSACDNDYDHLPAHYCVPLKRVCKHKHKCIVLFGKLIKT